MSKRVFDIFMSVFALALFSPLLLCLAAIVACLEGFPVFYLGWRAGRNGIPFRVIKFRTMVRDAELLGGAETPSDDPRVTPIGRMLRRYKLDELPQFYNVLKGEMSIVGPRPEVLQEVAQYGGWGRELLSVRPGITDWASIKFRHEDELLRGSADPHKTYQTVVQPEKIRLGLKYTREMSMGTDLVIIIRTIAAVIAD